MVMHHAVDPEGFTDALILEGLVATRRWCGGVGGSHARRLRGVGLGYTAALAVGGLGGYAGAHAGAGDHDEDENHRGGDLGRGVAERKHRDAEEDHGEAP